jgi:hypothetical protein
VVLQVERQGKLHYVAFDMEANLFQLGTTWIASHSF